MATKATAQSSRSNCFLVLRKRRKFIRAKKAMEAKKDEQATMCGVAEKAATIAQDLESPKKKPKIVHWDENEVLKEKRVFYQSVHGGWEEADIYIPGGEDTYEGASGQYFGVWEWRGWAFWPY